MAKNALHLINRSLVMLGATPIQGLSEKSAESTVMNDIYTGVRDGVLSAYAWQFATAKQPLNMVHHTDNGEYIYALPPDVLRIIKVSTDTYTMRSGRLYSPSASVILEYIYRPEEVDFPSYFDTALVARLAAESCLPLTDSTTRTQFLYNRAEQELKKARLTDASQLVNSALDMGILTEIR